MKGLGFVTLQSVDERLLTVGWGDAFQFNWRPLDSVVNQGSAPKLRGTEFSEIFCEFGPQPNGPHRIEEGFWVRLLQFGNNFSTKYINLSDKFNL